MPEVTLHVAFPPETLDAPSCLPTFSLPVTPASKLEAEMLTISICGCVLRVVNISSGYHIANSGTISNTSGWHTINSKKGAVYIVHALHSSQHNPQSNFQISNCEILAQLNYIATNDASNRQGGSKVWIVKGTDTTIKVYGGWASAWAYAELS